MDPNRKQQIINILKTNDSNSIRFAQTKEELIDKGYTDSEITLALYEFPYDGKPNAPKAQSQMEKLYSKDPEAADRVAQAILKDLDEKERDKAMADVGASYMAGQLHDYQAQGYYTSQYFDDIGAIPYFKFLFLLVVALGVGFQFDILEITLGIYSVIFIGYVIFTSMQYFRNSRN